ncbi:hypothetical protein HGRIS_004454 [Hohenbuehelia grisea]|uniref:Alcohol dehydrogenase-like C-terminal domain-containing protein n=1 Tax=Hohenbuehelia grisea TaxID=104357 RepID=A0ABR3JC34_9AGAR
MAAIPETQKALIIPEAGSQYTLIRRPVHRPSPGDVLVKIEAIGLNPAEDYLLDLGVTHVVDRNGDVKDQITKLLNGAGIKYIYDAVHTPISQDEIDFLAPGGRLLSVVDVPKTLRLSDGREVTSVCGATQLFKDTGRALFAKLPEFFEKGIIKPTRIEKIEGGLNGILVGLERLEAKQVSGYKLVVVPSETPEAN